MQLLGKIKHLQIQRDHLKIGQIPNRTYTIDPLLHVQQLRLSPYGAFGINADGEEIIDVHHMEHPKSRNRDNENGVSFNFTGHYDKMRSEFGDHVIDGCAGENILIENQNILTVETLGKQIVIKSQHDDGLLYLDDLMPIPPCAEFSCYMHQQTISGELMKTTLQFLEAGIRGFYVTLATNDVYPLIQTGDEVYIAD